MSAGRTARDRLRADCSRCAGLCCIVPRFEASSEFALDKPAGVPCPHLRPDSCCGVHDRLREKGFPGCTVYDCFGAGQQVVSVTFDGRDRRDPAVSAALPRVFAAMRDLHELLWYLDEARALAEAAALHPELDALVREAEAATQAAPATVEALDVDRLRGRAVPVLRRASAAARAHRPGPDLAGSDLTGRDLRGMDLRGASLRNALLIGADLRDLDLDRADLIGADLRGADVRGAVLTGALFLTRPQLASARGDRHTTVPPALEVPPHWT